MRREVFLMAIAEQNIQKWEYCLKLQEDAAFIDPLYRAVRDQLFQKIQVMAGTEPIIERQIQSVEKTLSDPAEGKAVHFLDVKEVVE